MGVKQTVFGSRAERSNYQKLQSRWGEKYALWHNIPFLNIFTREPLIDPDSVDLRPLIIPDTDWQRLKKTSIDYVLCDREHDKPIVAIDFDGLQDGFNAGREYRPGAENPFQWRDQITTLKLRVAHGSLFPYFVVGSRHFADVAPRVQFCIVDGIIGDILARSATHERLARGLTAADVGMSDADWDALHPWEQDELVQNFAMSVEIENDFEHNPVYSEVARLSHELGHPPTTHRFVDAPRTERAPHGQRLKEPDYWRAECTVQTDDVGTIRRTLWLPNFQAPGFIGLGLAEEIAHLMALDEVRRRRSRPW